MSGRSGGRAQRSGSHRMELLKAKLWRSSGGGDPDGAARCQPTIREDLQTGPSTRTCLPLAETDAAGHVPNALQIQIR